MTHPFLRSSLCKSSVLLFTLGAAGCAPEPTLDPAQAEEIDGFVRDALTRYMIPGAAVAVIKDGQVVHTAGFGIRGVADAREVTPRTRFMIGSITKSMTTLMMATLADEGRLDWDAPATSALPGFALSDPASTSLIRVRDLVNHSSGVPRYDTPLYIDAFPPTALVASLAEIPVVAPPGQVWNYSNQMVAAGGFAAAHLAGAAYEDTALTNGYAKLMRERVFDAIGMPSATLDFDAALASPNHALPNGYDPAVESVSAVPIAYERSTLNTAPASSVWADVTDLGRYAITQLTGLSPNGRRVVSQKNLDETHRSNIAITDGYGYALGWFVQDDYLGHPAVWHSGDTAGFSSNLILLPEQGLGFVVLANRSAAEPFYRAVTRFAVETLLGQPHADDADLMADELAMRGGQREIFEQSLAPDRPSVAPYLGDFQHHAHAVFSDQGFAIQGAFGGIPLRAIGAPGLFVTGGIVTGLLVADFGAGGLDPLIVGGPGDDGLEQVLRLERVNATTEPSGLGGARVTQ